jgi:hypothetical protein
MGRGGGSFWKNAVHLGTAKTHFSMRGKAMTAETTATKPATAHARGAPAIHAARTSLLLLELEARLLSLIGGFFSFGLSTGGSRPSLASFFACCEQWI